MVYVKYLSQIVRPGYRNGRGGRAKPGRLNRLAASRGLSFHARGNYLFADLFIMYPHPDYLDGFDILENLINKATLDIYSS